MRLLVRWPVLLLAVMMSLAACSKEKTDNVSVEHPEKAPDEVFTDFVTVESDSGRTQWRLTAPRANRYAKEKRIMLKEPNVEFFDKEGQLQTTLTAENGEYSEDKHDMLAYGSVRVESIEGDVLETDSLFWNNEQDKILSNSFVKLTRGRDVVTGYGLECDPNLNSVDIKRDVQAEIIDEAGEITQQRGKR